MTLELFRRQAANIVNEPVALPALARTAKANPAMYFADDGLVDAVNTALLVNQPLLLTGEPGTGKTQLAPALAYQLGLPWLRFQAKSTSQARDLFYTYDAVGHFRASANARRLDFVNFEALGQALLDASPWERVAELYRKPWPAGLVDRQPRASVVLIDEIDKAPRDFPNDVLAEIEEMALVLPEIGVTLPAPTTLRPVLVITSNSERDLPDAFLRRCVYYDIPFPPRSVLRDILVTRVMLAAGSPPQPTFIESALDLLSLLRDVPGMKKKPATAELIGFMHAIASSYPDVENPLSDLSVAVRRLGVLLKNPEDLELGKKKLTPLMKGA